MNTTQLTSNSYAADYVTRMNAAEGPCLTCAFACEAGGRNFHLHSKRLRNILREMSKGAHGANEFKETLDTLLSKAEELAGDKDRWSGDYEGVCVYVSRDHADLLRLSYAPTEISAISDSFYFRPAADALASRAELLALAVSYKSPQLFLFDGERARHFGEIELPESVYEFSEEGALDKNQHGHIRRSSPNGSSPAMVGHGFNSKLSPRDLNGPVFRREIGHAMAGLEESKKLPLVIIGDETIVGEFAKEYEHPAGLALKVMDAQAHPDEESVRAICSKLVHDAHTQAKEDALRTLAEFDQNSELYTDNLKDAYESATQGRISLCAVAASGAAWCHYDSNGSLSSANPETDEDAFEVLDRIYVEALPKGGDVVVVPAEKVPGGKKVAAILKW